nr:vegetative cell wall protein gp1-like [Aegilops tauschii subsp. strangulata]
MGLGPASRRAGRPTRCLLIPPLLANPNPSARFSPLPPTIWIERSTRSSPPTPCARPSPKVPAGATSSPSSSTATSSPRSPPDFLPDVGAALPVAPPRIVPVLRLDNRCPVPYAPPVRPSASASPPLSLVSPTLCAPVDLSTPLLPVAARLALPLPPRGPATHRCARRTTDHLGSRCRARTRPYRCSMPHTPSSSSPGRATSPPLACPLVTRRTRALPHLAWPWHCRLRQRRRRARGRRLPPSI